MGNVLLQIGSVEETHFAMIPAYFHGPENTAPSEMRENLKDALKRWLKHKHDEEMKQFKDNKSPWVVLSRLSVDDEYIVDFLHILAKSTFDNLGGDFYYFMQDESDWEFPGGFLHFEETQSKLLVFEEFDKWVVDSSRGKVGVYDFMPSRETRLDD